ncbi:MAG TPA: pyridoxamine 5'-phosphate oxidase family protein [Dinghuibacter sp.]|uniref:pyridoxamine 5'-phosphate oxidase family protein n=1 Tax=Dinghuibacter sp. TaxID=2024697 RepID=UPI002CD935D6|nr:pyridoxamine 5'-phosphate oxidase family protein [Dinghuibacter sp.]HTJ12499.1 pyridoxamine 5'-phosphate oxidase family protein [Dinghuibacter sp.]
MAKFFEAIEPHHRAFMEHQKMFFVATAPLQPDGHVNCSPKGGDCFRILSANRVAYLDYTGSGNETSAHILQNGRITIMFCAFDGAPNILRLYGRGFAVLPGEPGWASLTALFAPLHPTTRQVIVVDVFSVQTSCGYSVPLYAYEGERDQAYQWAAKKGVEGLEQYRQEKNRVSMDGLPTALF